MVTRVVLVRHGQTDFNVQGRFQGTSDVPLNNVGRSQARAAGYVLARLLGSGRSPQARIVSSPLARARETAGIVAGALVGRGFLPSDEGGAGSGPVTDARLIERSYGRFEGLTRAEIECDLPTVFASWQRTGESAEAGIESSRAVGARVSAAVKDHMAGAEGLTLVVVSHGSAIACGIEMMIGLDPQDFRGIRGLDNCHWSELVPGRGGRGWLLAAHNVGDTIQDAASRLTPA